MGFDINNFLNAESKKEVKSDWKPVKLSVHKLRPAAGKENFYHMDDKEIEETARTIELVGIQQYPVVKPIPGTDEYEIIAGHKRRLAILKLIAEGKTEYEMIPCKIETAEDSMAKILELQKKDKYNKERTVGSIEIKNQTETTADLCFFGDINSESLGEWQKYYPEDKAPKDVQDFLDQLEGVSKINVHINSGGGSVFGGIAIYNILKRYDAEITVYVEGLAASIASVIAMAGDKIIIPENAQMMIHKPSSVTWGNADDMRKEADILDGCQKVILNTYMQHTKEGVTAEEIDSLINAETWKNGKEWQEFFDIEVSEKSQATACKSEYFDKYNHLPDKLKEQPQQQINIDDLAERVAEKLKDATQPETPKVPENDVKQKTAEILEDLELI